MNKKFIRLAERRACLIEQVKQQRAAMSEEAEPWRVALARADEGLAALHYVKNHPVLLVGGTSILLAVVGPGRLWRWLGRGWVAMRMVNKVRIR